MSMFFLSDEQKLIQQNAREFAETVVVKYIEEMETTNRLPLELVKKAGDLGLIGICAPERIGGSEMGIVTGMLVIEEIAKVSPAYAASLYVSMFMMMDNEFPEVVVDKYVKAAIAGDIVMATPLVDPAGSQNQAEWPVFCVRDGDYWVLNGTRLFATNIAAASLYVVTGFDENHVQHYFCVPRDTAGFAAAHVEKKLGLHGQECGTTTYSNVRIHKSMECGTVEHPERGAFAFFGMIAVSTGLALGVLEKTRQYLLSRKYAGGVLYDNQALANSLAHEHAKLLMARGFIYDAANAADKFVMDFDVNRAVFAAKALVCPMCADIARKCMELYGGLGVCEDAGIARFVRDSMPPMIGDLPASGHESILAGINRMFPFC